MSDQPSVEVRTYTGATQEEALAAYSADVAAASAQGFRPTSQVWGTGTLTVTYERAAIAKRRGLSRQAIGWIVLIVFLAGGGGVAYTLLSKAGLAPAGKVTFGSSIDNATLALTGERSSFTTSDTLAWRAELSGPADTTSLTVLLVQHQPTGAESVLSTSTFAIANPSFNVIGTAFPLATVQPGSYVLRVLRGATTLAEGTFTVT